ncbi:hypothetical protein PPYR_07834 [Photinus pyralis]|uniref:SRCR domain-containing protein n=2 Tax=Photinus pyralis TaxID=7054 RepID=A0A1Y1LA89_PHOPY|nr:protein bark beetle isoform X2 [Photinus pyralis]KAB0799954.1 hypothetical protein PPYR_07834 [Photinus pyralis]
MVKFKSLYLLLFTITRVNLQTLPYYWGPPSTERNYDAPFNPNVIEHPGGIISNDRFVFKKDSSKPYLVRNDILVEKDGELVIEAGVKIIFEPQIGITVRGILNAVGTEDNRIVLTSNADTSTVNREYPKIRLVDGPSILAGRVQLFHKEKWRSVCTNSRNWTVADMQTACRELGFQGGSFFNWLNREMPVQPRLLYEEPRCVGTEQSLRDCQWSSRQLGSGVCDYHPDLAIECLSRYDTPVKYWRGIRFENAQNEKLLETQNTLYIPSSLSELKYVIVKYAGVGRDYNATSAIHIQGVPPIMGNLEVINSAYNGINITLPDAPVRITNCTLRRNRGYGVFINSSYGLAHIDGCMITDNGGDGVRYFHNEARPNEKRDISEISDFCTLAITSSQTYPIEIYADQSLFYGTDKYCSKYFTTRYGQVLTLDILRSETDRNNSATIELYDGSSVNNRLLTSFPIRNNTRPESVTTTSNQIYIVFKAEPRTNLVVYMRLTSGLHRTYELNVSRSDVSRNSGRGIAIDNLRSQLHVHKTSVSKNDHVAGVHVTSGVGHINITNSKISFNKGDGINITYTGGNRNISQSSISSNLGYGLAIWLNDTAETEYHFIKQMTVVEYSEIIKNADIGVLHGNFCGPSFINITGNKFENSLDTALEVLSCWLAVNISTNLEIGHNTFLGSEKVSIKIIPVLNLVAHVQYNWFKYGAYGAIAIKNQLLEEFNLLPAHILVEQNYFFENKGYFVVSLGLSPYADKQSLMFTRNFVKFNNITEPFQSEDGSASKLNPRSRVAAAIVIGSSNILVYRNIIENPSSRYEIGSHFEDQSKILNCSYNWLGFSEEEKIFHRIFDRTDRYNLAKVVFVPYLLHNSNPSTTRFNYLPLYVPIFRRQHSNVVGGEVEGEETLAPGEYVVEKDINIRPGGKLTLEPGVTLRFPASVGIMVGGRLEAHGIGPDSIKFTMKEEIKHPIDEETYETDIEKVNEQTEVATESLTVPIRLLGEKAPTEGRLQVNINNRWGTVCNYGWTIENAALVCNQLGFVLNRDDWNMQRNEIPSAGISEEVILSNVKCTMFDTDISNCKAESVDDFEYSCSHENDVGVRCYESSWAGMRFSVLAERSNLQYITIEKAGLLDYTTNYFKPALQIDFAHHNFESIKVVDNLYDGLGVLYSDIYTSDSVNIVKNSEFSRNKGAGISFKQLGLKVQGSTIENNEFGIRHNPALTNLQQRELAGWFSITDADIYYKPFWIPLDKGNDIIVNERTTKYLVTSRVINEDITRSYKISCPPGYVLGIQLLNPIENRSTESILIHNSITYNGISDIWNVTRDLTVFPTTSTTHGIILDYTSGPYATGGTVFVISAINAPVQNIHNKIVKGPIPTLSVSNSKIRSNKYGVHASFYNRYLNELGEHFLRKANESMKFLHCEISHNKLEAIYIHSPHWDLHQSNISEVTIMLNNTLITDNGHGIYHFSRDMRFSNNLFHYILQDDTIERNGKNGFAINLPYVWQYNENFTHSVYMHNNTWRNNKDFAIVIDGHFAIVNITKNVFVENSCKNSLLAFKGMEKKLLINFNKIENNNGRTMVEFSSNSQSEILGTVPARFVYNELKRNRHIATLRNFGVLQVYSEPTCVIGFNGIQKININRNLIVDNNLDYQLIAGIKTAKIDNYLDAKENWWGTIEEREIEKAIFDFDDWNNHAIAQFRPFLLHDSFEASHSVSFETEKVVDLDNLGGRLYEDLIIPMREEAYVVKSDITVMTKATLIIQPGVVMEFGPNIGILVLGVLKAEGMKGYEITFKPLTKPAHIDEYRGSKRVRRQLENFVAQDTIRLCKGRQCQEGREELPNEGFLEYFNKTTLQWIPMCDPRFTERNAQVVCRELGFDWLTAYFSFDIRIEFHSNSLSRIWSWPEPLECKGTEMNYEECPIRLNGQQFGHRHECKWNDKFVFIHCGKHVSQVDYWGGIRFADAQFEQHFYEHRIHDIHTHDTVKTTESILEFVNVVGAGILHNEKSPAVQSVIKSPKINYVNVKAAASHGINLISPTNTINLLGNNVEDTLGVGLNILSLTGEGRESTESSFTPLKGLQIPYHLFSLIDVCDTTKVVNVEERVLIYYKYDNHPVSCVKIFRSSYNVKPFGFRLLQFNLFNTSDDYGIPDFISLHDGDIYNVSSKVIAHITMDSEDFNGLYRTKEPSLSIKLFAKGASSSHGFIAEVVTLPISAIGFNRDVQHNISFSVINRNREGGLLYMSAGEVNPIVTIEKNQFTNNCEKLYGNFSTCTAAIEMDIQNTQSVFFRNNLVQSNQGGLSIKSDSRGSATSLKGWIHNNLFVNNTNYPAMYVEGRKSSPYQEVTIYRNYFTRNVAVYENNIVLKQVVSNFSFNYIKRNIGLQNLEVSGFDKVRLPIYQTTTHNGFYNNYAVHTDSRSTIVAGTAGQHYVDNIFFNPDNDYEMITVNRSFTLEVWKTKIDAAHNYWGVNTTLAVRGRIRDQTDDARLLEVVHSPYYMNNQSILNGKCPPGWDLVGNTCYMFIGAPMSFFEANKFCRDDNASIPYLVGTTNYLDLYDFLKKQQQWYLFSDRIWVQHIDKINQCTMFAYQTVEIEDCYLRLPFICEIDPKVTINPLTWHGDTISIAVIGCLAVALCLIIFVIACWWSKSKYRHAQRLQRRNSIRQSLHSVRSLGSIQGGFSDFGYRRGKPSQMSTRSTDTLTKNSDYKKMDNGSIDSMEKSTCNSSIEDNQSYDIYETHNPPAPPELVYNPTIEFHKSPTRYGTQTPTSGEYLAFKNEGFRDNSTFGSANTSNHQSRADSVQLISDDTPESQDDSKYMPYDYYNTDTLPLGGKMDLKKSDSTLDSDYKEYGSAYAPNKPNMSFLKELKSKVPNTNGYVTKRDLPPPPDPPSSDEAPVYNTHGVAKTTDENILKPRAEKSKSEIFLETNFDYVEGEEEPFMSPSISESRRSQSQPLETAM